MTEDPRHRWLDVHPLPDPQGRAQQMNYLDGYALALQDALAAVRQVAGDLKTEPSDAQVGRDRLQQAVRRQLGQMLAAAQLKLKEVQAMT